MSRLPGNRQLFRSNFNLQRSLPSSNVTILSERAAKASGCFFLADSDTRGHGMQPRSELVAERLRMRFGRAGSGGESCFPWDFRSPRCENSGESKLLGSKECWSSRRLRRSTYPLSPIPLKVELLNYRMSRSWHPIYREFGRSMLTTTRSLPDCGES